MLTFRTPPNQILRRVAIFVAVCVLSISASVTGMCFGEDVFINPNYVPKAVQGIGIDQKLGEQVPTHLIFRNSNGESTSLAKVLKSGKPVLLTLNYSNCPGLCIAQLNGLVQGVNQIPALQVGKDFTMVSISIDPSETREKAEGTQKRYSRDLFDQHDPKAWQFWVGTQESIRQLTDAVGFRYTYDEKHHQYNHPSAAIFISPSGRITRYVFEIGFVPDTLKMALVEAGEGVVGSPLDMLALWCAHFDPEENRYSASANKLLSIVAGCFVTIGLCCLLPYWLVRKQQTETTLAQPDNSTRTPSDFEQR